ncbi:hypothetical protein [Hymenobacter lapidiphilus]|nr:hypothetical protein [Hymenobacter lapidiphilus]
MPRYTTEPYDGPHAPRWWHKLLLVLLLGAVGAAVKWCSTGQW